jgi:hypothetical protein
VRLSAASGRAPDEQGDAPDEAWALFRTERAQAIASWRKGLSDSAVDLILFDMWEGLGRAEREVWAPARLSPVLMRAAQTWETRAKRAARGRRPAKRPAAEDAEAPEPTVCPASGWPRVSPRPPAQRPRSARAEPAGRGVLIDRMEELIVQDRVGRPSICRAG